MALSDPAQIAASSDGAPGSNGNLLNLVDLRDQNIVNGQRPDEFYSNLISRLGNEIAGASFELEAEGLVLRQLRNQRSNISGVSLDEEAVNLIRFQRAFEASALLVLNRGDVKNADQFIRNISSLRSRLEAADGALNNAIIVMTRAISLGTQGANGTLSQANRDTIAIEIDTLGDQLLALSNTSFRGVYLLAGTAVDLQPFVLDVAQPSGVRYDGNTNVNNIEITDGQLLPAQVPGSQIFADAAADLFGALNDLALALRTDTNIGAAVDQVGVAFRHLNAERTFYGTTLASLDNSEIFLDREKIQLAQREDDLVADDFAASVSEFSSVETARNAILEVGSRISQLSLFDFLR